MSFAVEELGLEDGPLLVCLHGLMGGPTEFDNISKPWLKKFRCLMVDLNAASRVSEWVGDNDAALRGLDNIKYDESAPLIGEYLKKHHPGKAAYFVGISFGGKIIYDFITKYPKLFKAGVITDLGPGLISESELFKFVDQTIPSINLNQPWSTLKKEIHEKVPERPIRILMQTQLHKPEGSDSYQWQSAMLTLKEKIFTLRITEQWEVLDKIEGPIIFLLADYLSATSASSLERISKDPHFIVRPVRKASHFIHVTHHKAITNAVLELLDLETKN
jgi:pimeloyl-ACP methyl ester carboxylesterase